MLTDPSIPTDNQLKDFFQSRKPAIGDGRLFMDSLKAKLLAVEEINRMKAAHIRHTRKLLSIVFLCGILAGTLLLAAMQALHLPEAHNSLLAWFQSVPEPVKLLLCAAIVTAALLPSLKALNSG